MNGLNDHRDPLSTVVKALSDEQLDRLDRALVAGNPPTLSACYELFELKNLGISTDAFYRYARRFRSSLRALALARHGVADTDATETIIPRLVGQRMIHALMTDQFTPRTLLRLAEAYRMTAQVEHNRRRLDMIEDSTIYRFAANPNSQLPALPDTATPLALPADNLPGVDTPSTQIEDNLTQDD